jgi:signal transduction histidine kinase
VLNPAQEDVNIGELIADVVNDAIYEAEANARKFEFTGSCDVVVKGDAEMLCRAIENVVRNALKHTLIGSAVILESTVDLRHNVLRLAILDRGPGVPDTELKAIFEPFFRSARAQRSVDGHGLGLAIAQRVVTAYGGSIIASNREGGGLCIEILLPFKGVTSSPYP